MTGGCLVLVVGPSGAGKDTLLRHARAALERDPRYCFPKRLITRPAGDPHEDHIALTEAEFRARERDGAFSLVWRAHGLSYALPATLPSLVAEGRIVAANMSRTVIGEARSRFPRTAVIQVTAGRETLRRRLGERGRESPEGRAGRLARQGAAVEGGDVRTLVNDGPLEPAVEAFVDMLRSCAG